MTAAPALEVGRLAVAGLALLLLLAWTARRVVSDDMSDPSLSIGRDYLLVRASGMVAIALVGGVAAVLLAPEILGSARGIWIGVLLLGLLAFWAVSETLEGGA